MKGFCPFFVFRRLAIDQMFASKGYYITLAEEDQIPPYANFWANSSHRMGMLS